MSRPKNDSANPHIYRQVLRPIQRRAPLTVRRSRVSPPQLKIATTPPQATTGQLFRRSMQWFWASFNFCLLIVWDGFRGQNSPRNRGRRLREACEQLGGTAVKIGRQLALRIDLLPFAVCDELYSLRVDAPHFDLSYSVARIEAAAGKPLSEIFSSFDPQPIRSTITASIYQAILKNGERVAVKVRRPGVSEQMAADLKCMTAFTYLPEVISLVKSGFLDQVRSGLRQVLLEEVDFTREARYQRVFRRWAKRAKFHWLYAPKIYTEYCTADVMVSEFVSGILYTEILAIAGARNREGLDYLKALDINPGKIARRVLHLQFWGYLEALFYVAEPDPRDIAIAPGGKLVFLEFGSRGTTSRRIRDDYRELMERVEERDAAGMADIALHMLSPLPHLDVYELKKKIESAFHRFLIAMQDPRRRWWERGAMNLWLCLLEATRGFDLPLSFEVLHLARASILYDSLIFPLDPKLKLLPRYRRYLRAAARRNAREYARRLDHLSPKLFLAQLVSGADAAERTMRRASWALSAHMNDLPAELTATIAKAAFVSRELIRFLLSSLLVVIFSYALTVIWRSLRFGLVKMDWLDILRQVVYHPLVISLVVITLVISIRRVLFRLEDVDEED